MPAMLAASPWPSVVSSTAVQPLSVLLQAVTVVYQSDPFWICGRDASREVQKVLDIVAESKDSRPSDYISVSVSFFPSRPTYQAISTWGFIEPYPIGALMRQPVLATVLPVST